MARLIDVPIDTQRRTNGAVAESFAKGVIFTEIRLDGMTLPDIAGGANLAVGRDIFTFPPGAIKVIGSSLNAVSLKQTQGNVTADTPDLGLGTIIASGVNAVLSANAAFENIMTGQTMDDCDGTAETVAVSTELLIQTADSHVVYLNVADGWAASGDDGILVKGIVRIAWTRV